MKNYISPKNSRFNRYSIRSHFIDFIVKIEFCLIIFVCILFIALSKSGSKFTKDSSDLIYNIVNPVANVISSPFRMVISVIVDFGDLVDAKKENIRLRDQNQELQSALLKLSYVDSENRELKEILNFVLPKSTKFTTLKIFGRTYGIFNHNFTVTKDPNQDLHDGDITIFKKSVIGRVVYSFDDMARVMLLTDSKSRIPVISSNSRNRGILTGNNSQTMEIKYLSKNHSIVEGELIFTSSDGDQIPPGILVGKVTKVSGKRAFVRMAEDVNDIDQVTIIQY